MKMTRPFKEYVTPEQYANAKTHWEKLIANNISGAFDMSLTIGATAYMGFNKTSILAPNRFLCGTIACSLGYLPETLNAFVDFAEGINKPLARLCEEKIGIRIDHLNEATYCFGLNWANVDNTAQGAGIRMRILYENGLPGDWKRQMIGLNPLSYKNELEKLLNK